MSGVDDVTVYEDSDAAAVATEVPAQAGEVKLPPDFPANAAPAGEGSYRLMLQYPVKIKLRGADQKVTEQVTRELVLHRLKGKHQNEIRRAEPEDVSAQMIASSARIDFGKAKMLADEMDAVDLAAVLRVILFFTTPGQRIGR